MEEKILKNINNCICKLDTIDLTNNKDTPRIEELKTNFYNLKQNVVEDVYDEISKKTISDNLVKLKGQVDFYFDIYNKKM